MHALFADYLLVLGKVRIVLQSDERAEVVV